MMSKKIRTVLLIAAVLFYGYYILLVAVDFAFGGISLLWLMFGLGCTAILVLDKKNLLKKPPKKLTVAAAVLMCAAFFYCVGCLVFICTPQKYTHGTRAAYIILLGGGVKLNGEPSHVVRQRIQAAADCWFALEEKCPVIVTGGQGFLAPFAEAYLLSSELQKHGIPDTFIRIEPQAQDTIQNFVYSAELIAAERNCSVAEALTLPVVVVTGDSHIARSLLIAGRLGYTNAAGWTAPTPLYAWLNTYLREILSVLKLQLRILCTGQPSPR